MAALIRLFFLGWAFAIVLFVAWLGALFPDAGSGRRQPGVAGPAAGAGGDGPQAVAPPMAEVTADGAESAAGPGQGETGPTPALADQDCPQQETVAARFFPQSAVLRPVSQDEIAAFGLRLRSQPCVADVAGNYCRPDEVAITVVGHAVGSPGTEIDDVALDRLSFRRALAVASVLLANDVTVRSVVGVGDDEAGPIAGSTASAEDDRPGWVDLGLVCPRVVRG
ncbi:MAG: hypothetical protein AAFN30_04245 [Actinomycetota bacterium]